MNMSGPPQGRFDSGAGAGPPPPMAVQQTTVIQVGTQKSVVGAVLLAFFFGPLGMLYATVPGALIMFVISFPVAILTLGLGLLITLPICAIWAGVAASSYNDRLGGLSSQQAAVAGPSAVSPAGWHDDPAGSGRLRYHDGMGWTNHYAEHASQEATAAPANRPAPQLEPAAPPEPTEAESAVSDAETRVIESEPEKSDPAEAEAEAEAPTAVNEAEPQRVFCGACGHKIVATARFCSACGETQAIA
jgi:Protein of unknown function (DUF2510)